MSAVAWRRDGGAALALVVAVAALHPRLILGTPWRFGADALEYAIPHAALLFRELAHGRLPLWNPFHDGGAPFLAQPPWMGPIYPGVVLFGLAPGRALDAGFLLHLISFAVGSYALGRIRGLRRVPAWLAALALGAGTPMSDLVRLGYLPEAVAASYLPWVLVCLDRGIRGTVPVRGAIAGAGVCLGLMHLGGHLVASGAVLFATLVYTLTLGGTHDGRAGLVRAAGLLATSEALGVALAAVQIAPLVASGLASSLSGGREISAEYAYLSEPWRIGQFLFARFDPSGKGHVFLGVVLLPFLALARQRWRGTDRTHLDLWVTAAGCVVLSLGDATPLWGMLRAALPPLTIFSYFYFFLIPAALALALLAAHGLDAWLASRGDGTAASRHLQVAVVVLAALALATLAWIPGDLYADGQRLADLVRGSLPWSLAALAGAFLASVWPRASALTISLALVAELAHFASPDALDRASRFDTEDHFDRAGVADALPPPGAGRVLGVERTRRARDWVLRRNGGLVVGYEDVGLDSKLPLARVTALADRLAVVELDWVTRLAASKRAPGAEHVALELAPDSRDVRILDVLGVTTLVTDVSIAGGAYLRPLRDTAGDAAEDARIEVWERATRAPRAFAATIWRSASSPGEALARLLDEPSSPLVSPVLEIPDAPSPAVDTPPACAPVKRVWAPGAVDLDTICDAQAFLVTGEIAAQGWRATVDGARAVTAVANTITLAVSVPAGAHHVEIRYVPAETAGGALVSAASWIAVMAFALAGRRPRRREPP